MVFRRAAGLFGGASVGHAILLLGSLAAALAFGARAFGEFAVYGGVVGIASTIAALRLEYALPRSGGASRAVILWVCLGLALISALVLGVAVLAAWGLLDPDAANGHGSAAAWAGLIALGVSGNSAMVTLRLWLLAIERIRLVAWMEALRAGVQIGAWAVAFAVAASGEALALGHGLACWTVTALALGWGSDNRRRVAAGLRRLRRAGTRRRVRAAVAPHLRVLFYGAPAAVINASVLHGIVLGLGGLFGSAVAGNYSLAQRITTQPATLISRAVTEACMSTHVGSRERIWGRIAVTFRRWSLLMAAVGVPASVAAVGAYLLWGEIAATTEWALVPLCLAALIPASVAQLLGQPWGPLFMVGGESGTLLTWDTARLALVAGLALALAVFGGDPGLAVVAIAAILIGTYGVLWAMVARRTRACAAPGTTA